jgi:hypothetical protein
MEKNKNQFVKADERQPVMAAGTVYRASGLV